MASISKLDYLKKYESKPTKDPEKKKRRKLKGKAGAKQLNSLKIVDNDIKFISKPSKGGENSSDEGKFDLQEEKPILFAKDGAQVINEQYKRRQEEIAAKWAPVKSSETQSTKTHGPPDGPATTGPQRQRHDSSDSDMSPPRAAPKTKPKRQRHDSTDSDLSPDRAQPSANRGSDSDLSPQRATRTSAKPDSDGDMSPVRHSSSSAKTTGESSGRRNIEAEVVHSSGRATGLQSASVLKAENERSRKEKDARMKALSASESGRGAETVYREKKSGKRVDLKHEEHLKRRAEEEKQAELERTAEWGKGVAQSDAYKERLTNDAKEMDKPLARYKDDNDLDELLKSRERADDPMLAFIQKKRQGNKPAKPRYNGPAPPPNRFNIWPGYRWDGVDRSNGFEKKRFQRVSEKTALESVKYKWSTEAM